MPAEMKEMIADAAQQLMRQKRGKKLTVTDIVEACHITRQTYYYHFKDIPDLFDWMVEQKLEKTIQLSLA